MSISDSTSYYNESTFETSFEADDQVTYPGLTKETCEEVMSTLRDLFTNYSISPSTQCMIKSILENYFRHYFYDLSNIRLITLSCFLWAVQMFEGTEHPDIREKVALEADFHFETMQEADDYMLGLYVIWPQTYIQLNSG
jgi:hypothetical protein